MLIGSNTVLYCINVNWFQTVTVFTKKHFPQVDGKLTVNVQVDDVDTSVLTQEQTYQLVDRLSDLVELPSAGSSVALELVGQREKSPTRLILHKFNSQLVETLLDYHLWKLCAS